MLERFLVNRQAVNLLCAQDRSLPKFSPEDWATVSMLKEVTISK